MCNAIFLSPKWRFFRNPLMKLHPLEPTTQHTSNAPQTGPWCARAPRTSAAHTPFVPGASCKALPIWFGTMRSHFNAAFRKNFRLSPLRDDYTGYHLERSDSYFDGRTRGAVVPSMASALSAARITARVSSMATADDFTHFAVNRWSAAHSKMSSRVAETNAEERARIAY